MLCNSARRRAACSLRVRSLTISASTSRTLLIAVSQHLAALRCEQGLADPAVIRMGAAAHEPALVEADKDLVHRLR